MAFERFNKLRKTQLGLLLNLAFLLQETDFSAQMKTTLFRTTFLNRFRFLPSNTDSTNFVGKIVVYQLCNLR